MNNQQAPLRKVYVLLAIGFIALALCALIFAVDLLNGPEEKPKSSSVHFATPASEDMFNASAGSLLKDRVPAVAKHDDATISGVAQGVCTDYRRGSSFVGAVNAVKLTLSIEESPARAFVESSAAIFCPEYEMAGKSG